jgi:hypothetical protein
MMKKRNIFYFVIDSVRTFKTGLDDRDRLDIMDEFSKDSVEFTNCYTSAPSSILAAGALFTGYPSAFIGRHFNDWRFRDSNISTIANLVDEYGYTSIPILNAREEREKFQFMLPPFPSKLLPKKYHLYDYAWTNKEVTEVFKHIIENGEVEEPFIYSFWYDCRRDPNTSKHVEDALKTIKEMGFYDDSLIIMTSDHGYPNPSTKLDENFFKSQSIGHDMILTDDNIKTPLFIKYPGSPENKKIKNVVGHVDIIPTIYDLLTIPLDKPNDTNKFRGKTLIPIINGKEYDNRVRRSDTRLTMDVGRMTALRSGNYKYLYFHDSRTESLYNLKEDPTEFNNLLGPNYTNSIELDSFREHMKSYEKELYKFHKKTLEQVFKASKSIFERCSIEDKILIVSPAPEDLIKILVELISKIVDTSNIIIASIGGSNFGEINRCRVLKIKSASDDNLNELHNIDFAMSIFLTHNSRRVFLTSEIIKSIRKTKAKRKFLMDYNFEMVKYFSSYNISSYLKLFFDWGVKSYFYKQEPQYFIKDVTFFTKRLARKFLKKNKNNEDVLSVKEVIEYRSYQLKKSDQGLNKMDNENLEYELGRIKDWGKD